MTGKDRLTLMTFICSVDDSKRHNWLMRRYFCNAVMNSPASDFTSAASKAEDTSTSSRVFLVRKAGMRLLNEGMDEYVAMIEKRMRGRKGVKVKV